MGVPRRETWLQGTTFSSETMDRIEFWAPTQFLNGSISNPMWQLDSPSTVNQPEHHPCFHQLWHYCAVIKVEDREVRVQSLNQRMNRDTEQKRTEWTPLLYIHLQQRGGYPLVVHLQQRGGYDLYRIATKGTHRQMIQQQKFQGQHSSRHRAFCPF